MTTDEWHGTWTPFPQEDRQYFKDPGTLLILVRVINNSYI